MQVTNGLMKGGAIEGATSFFYNVSSSGSFYVKVVDSQGCSIISESVIMTALDVATVSSIGFSNVLSTTATLDWNNTSPTGLYNIRYSDNGGSTWISVNNHLGSIIFIKPQPKYNLRCRNYLSIQWLSIECVYFIIYN